MRKAMFCGSFDPFTIGHFDLVKRASKMFDELHIVIVVNANKKRHYDSNWMAYAIQKTVEDENIFNVKVVSFDGLVAKYAKDNQIDYSIRGLRNSMDYNYEENIAEVNKLINDNLEQIYLRTSNAAISSSMVRELFSYGEDVSKFVPNEILKVMKDCRILDQKIW